jgi:hypothetical protein
MEGRGNVANFRPVRQERMPGGRTSRFESRFFVVTAFGADSPIVTGIAEVFFGA